jgi:hypothetical protein
MTMSTDSDPGDPGSSTGGGLGAALGRFANWFNESVVGNPWTYVFCIAAVVFTYLLIPLQGYDKWNLTSGLFFNTTSSSVELITGVGAVVGVYAVRRAQHQHDKALARHAAAMEHHTQAMANLHAKVDQIQAQQGVAAAAAEQVVAAGQPTVTDSRKLRDPREGRP